MLFQGTVWHQSQCCECLCPSPLGNQRLRFVSHPPRCRASPARSADGLSTLGLRLSSVALKKVSWTVRHVPESSEGWPARACTASEGDAPVFPSSSSLRRCVYKKLTERVIIVLFPSKLSGFLGRRVSIKDVGAVLRQGCLDRVLHFLLVISLQFSSRPANHHGHHSQSCSGQSNKRR